MAYERIARKLGTAPASTDLEKLKHDSFCGREKENLVFPIALANLVLHGIDQPNLWHGNALTGRATYAALFDHAPAQFDVILTNPPFGGKEGKDAQKNFAFETGAGAKTNLLFFTKGKRTERIWYYDLSWVKVGKKTPLTLAHFGFGTRTGKGRA